MGEEEDLSYFQPSAGEGLKTGSLPTICSMEDIKASQQDLRFCSILPHSPLLDLTVVNVMQNVFLSDLWQSLSNNLISQRKSLHRPVRYSPKAKTRIRSVSSLSHQDKELSCWCRNTRSMPMEATMSIWSAPLQALKLTHR